MTIKLHHLTILISGMCLAGYASAGSVVIDDNWVNSYGATVSGTFTGTTTTPAVSVTTKKPVTIQNTTVTGTGNLIVLSAGTNATVINTTGTEINSNISGQSNGSFIRAHNPASLLVKNCTATGVYFGVYVQGFSGNTAAGQTIKILNNVFNNIDGRVSNGRGGYVMSGYSTQPHAHAIQLNAVQSVPNIEIAWNQSIAIPYQSLVSDVINLYSSSGTAASHLLVHDNFIQGAMGPTPGNGEKYSGGGIITDGKSTDTASSATAYVDIYNNQVTMTANYGVAVAAGHDNNIYQNRVVSAGALSDGTFYAMTFANGANNGNLQNQTSAVYFNNHVHDNVLGLIRNASGKLGRADWWLPGQSTTENNQHLLPYDTAHPTAYDEQNEFTAWQAKLLMRGITIGAQQSTGKRACTLTASVVNSTQLWDVKVDGFHTEVTLKDFPVDSSGNIKIDGTLIMKNNFKIKFWSSEGYTTSFSGNTGKFSGTLYGTDGSGRFTLDGYLTDGSPVVMNTGDQPLQSLVINGISCTLAL